MGDRRSRIVDRACTDCGDAFQGTRARRYCDNCKSRRTKAGARKARTDDIVDVTCRDCGATFTGHHRRVRCDPCRQKHDLAKSRTLDAKRRQPGYTPRKVGGTDTCAHCGDQYTVRHVNQRLCSDACRRAHRTAYMAARAEEKRPPARICGECGREFRPKFADAVYCSKVCNDAVRNRRPDVQERGKDRRHRRLYGISTETVEAMEALQGSRCMLCGREFSREGDRKEKLRNVPRVDHDHATGEVRGLLCHACNTTLGKVDDRALVLQRMIEYLTFPEHTDPVDRVRAFLQQYPLD